jgi:putative tryptophan/tyrosine transport system substrate-binding protein
VTRECGILRSIHRRDFIELRRREFFSLVASASVALPFAARAQGEGKFFRLGVLSPASAQLESIRTIALPELAKAGIVEGRNLVFDARTGSMEELARLAEGIVAAKPDVVMGVSGAAINALRAASNTVPIVMAFSDYDPVAAGFAASFARPRGNITGIAMLATVLDSKRLDLLHEAVPAARRIAVLLVSESRHQSTLAGMRSVASTDGIELVPVYAELPAEYPRAFAAMRTAGAQALAIVAAPEFNRDAEILAASAIDAGLPTICEWGHMAVRGCLMGYGPVGTELWRRSADYVIRILRGSPPGELPIEQPTHFEFIVNAKTAKRLALTVPASVLVRADEVIE